MSNRSLLGGGLALVLGGALVYGFLSKPSPDKDPPSVPGPAVAETKPAATTTPDVETPPDAELGLEAKLDENEADALVEKSDKKDRVKTEPVKSEPVKTEKAAAKETPPVSPPKPLFKGWEKPALVLVLSGEQHGYIEPCGCALVQLGGLARRDDLLKQINERKWPVTGLDVGGLVNRNRRQSRIKFETELTCLKLMKYSGLALGVEELRLGPENLLSLHNPQELPFLSANIVFFGAADLGMPLSHTLVTLGGRKVGVTAIFGLTLKEEVIPPGGKQEDPPVIDIQDPAKALAKVVPELEMAKPDLLVLLSHAKLDETKALAKAFPQFDVIISTGGPEDPDPKPMFIGKTMLLTVGAKAKHVGVLGYFPDDPQQRLRYELEDMDGTRFKTSPRMVEQMKFYQERLKDEKIATTEPALNDPSKSDSEFVGAAKCGECHTNAYKIWKGTGHAKATESLKIGRGEATWISRIYDPECISCHVTGWNPQDMLRYKSGYLDEKTSAHLLGNQCENCHGPGSKHVVAEEKFKLDNMETEDLKKLRSDFDIGREELAIDRTCRQCHDLDNSPGFKFAEYWEMIKHPGKK